MGSKNGKTENCNHKGKWGSLGTSLLNFPDKIMFIHHLFCKECGASKMEAKIFPLPDQPKVAAARMGLGKKPPGGMPPGGQRFA